MANYDGIMSFWKDRKKNKTYEIADAQARDDISSLATVASTGDYDDLLNKPTIPAAQVNADWNVSSGVAQILNKPSFLGNYFRGYSTCVEPTEGYLNYYITDLENGSNLPDLKDGFILSLKHKNISQPVFVHNSRGSTVVHYKNATIPAYGYNGNITGSANPSHEILLVYSKYNEQGVEDGTGKFIAFLIGDTEDMKTVAFTGQFADLTGTPTIPTALSDLSDDSTHRVVTDTEKSTWDGKQDALTAGTNISISNNTISATDTKPDNYYANDSFADVTDMATGGTWKECGQFQIAKGTWIVSVALQYPSNATGMRSVGMYIDSSSSLASDVTGIVYQQTLQAANGGATNIVLTQIVRASNSSYIHIMGRQTSGSAMGTTTSPIRVRARAIRILP